MLKIAVCDDDAGFLEQTKQMLRNWRDGQIPLGISLFTDADALIRCHSADPFDILFLDVVMPLLNGITAAKEIRELDPTVRIVFLTSSPEYAVDSYRVKANDYLLKPIRPEGLCSCMDDLYDTLHREAPSIPVRTVGAVRKIPMDRIEYLEAQNKHVLCVLSDGQTLKAVDPLYVFEQRLTLTEGFFKCSRSYILNIHRIDTYTQKEVRMRSGARIPVSRNCQREFEGAYFSVIFGKAGEV